MVQKIAVIGAGPKGVAIAAKAWAMEKAGMQGVPQITVFDPLGVGASWRGNDGYTDGVQPLCTLAERDLGFPYDRFDGGGSFAPDVAEAMQAHFSWHAFSVSQGSGATGYERWVLTGRRPPAHADFADYLAFALQRSGASFRAEQVSHLAHDAARGRWCLATDSSASLEWFDGVVVTGNGPPSSAASGGVPVTGLYDARDFWSRTGEVRVLLKRASDPQVVVIGAGGGGAAVTHWFVRQGLTCPVRILGREPTLYTRKSGFFEERLFTDMDAWHALPDHAKDAFLRHTTAGVVWEGVLAEITRRNVFYECCDVVRVVPRTRLGGAPPEFDVVTQPAPDTLQNAIDAALALAGSVPAPKPAPSQVIVDATVVIDARGFDRFAFAKSIGLEPGLAAFFGHGDPRQVERVINDAMEVDAPGFPRRLHLPAFGSRRGPGATNLMALGWLANRVLSAY